MTWRLRISRAVGAAGRPWLRTGRLWTAGSTGLVLWLCMWLLNFPILAPVPLTAIRWLFPFFQFQEISDLLISMRSSRGTGTSASVHRSAATLVKSSRDDYLKWLQSRPTDTPSSSNPDKVLDPEIVAHKNVRAKLIGNFS